MLQNRHHNLVECFAAPCILPGATYPLLLAMHWKLSRSLTCDPFPALGSAVVYK